MPPQTKPPAAANPAGSLGRLARRPVGDLFAWHRALRGSVSPAALGLALALSTRMDKTGIIPTKWNPSLEVLARDLSYGSGGRKSIVRLTRELETAGFLEVVRSPSKKKVNQYRATVPLAPDPDSGDVPAQDQDEGDNGVVWHVAGTQRGSHPSPSSHLLPPRASDAAQKLPLSPAAETVLRRVCETLAPNEWWALRQGFAAAPVLKKSFVSRLERLCRRGGSEQACRLP